MKQVRRFIFPPIFTTIAFAAIVFACGEATAAEKLRFMVGPYQPTPADTKKVFEPFFKYLAEKLGRDYELVATADFTSVAIALSRGQTDAAWTGPWSYVLARKEGGAQPIATVKYDGNPTYRAEILAKPELKIAKWPEDARGKSISLTDVGSTSGWLIPTFWFASQDINPKTFFRYREGSTHAANVLAVVSGQVDLATDYDRNTRAMIEKGVVKEQDLKVVWMSEPLPNDAFAVRKGLDPELVKKLQGIITGITEEQAKAIMPKHYTGWIPATPASYKLIEMAGIAVVPVSFPVSR